MKKVISITAKPGYRLAVTFDDGMAGEICIKERLFGPMFEPLLDEQLFQQVSIDEFGVICWPNKADLASDVVYEQIRLRLQPALQ